MRECGRGGEGVRTGLCFAINAGGLYTTHVDVRSGGGGKKMQGEGGRWTKRTKGADGWGIISKRWEQHTGSQDGKTTRLFHTTFSTSASARHHSFPFPDKANPPSSRATGTE